MKRLESLDIFRGMTMMLMIIVNNQLGGAFNQLQHASTFTYTLCDLVFPFFIFIMGASTYFSLKKLGGTVNSATIVRILRRTITIFALGIFLHWLPFDKSFLDVRIMGVLQRIAIVYFLGSLFTLWVRNSWAIIATSVAILVGYWLLLKFAGWGIVASVDQAVLGKNMYSAEFEPEGILSTLPSLVNMFAGFLCARLISSEKLKLTLPIVIMVGVGLIFAGMAIGEWIMPISKNYWTSSYVFVTVGWAMAVWGVLSLLIDLGNNGRWFTFFKIYGTNAILSYVLAWVLVSVLWRFGVGSAVTGWLTSFLPGHWAALVWSLSIALLCWLIVWPLYRKKIYLKL